MTLRLSVCVEMIFGPPRATAGIPAMSSPFLDRLDAVATAGATAYEFWRWADKDLPAIAERAGRLGLTCAGIVGSSGGSLVDSDQRAAFLSGLRASVEAARVLGAATLIVTTGQALPGVARGRQHDAIVAALRDGAVIAADAGLTLVLEPLNTRVDHAGYYLDSTAEGLAIVDQVDSSAVKLLYDCYHAQVMEGNLTRTLLDNLARIGHVHVADCPGRHQPGTGEINYATIFAELARSNYRGYVGLEYRPTGDHATALRSTLALMP